MKSEQPWCCSQITGGVWCHTSRGSRPRGKEMLSVRSLWNDSTAHIIITLHLTSGQCGYVLCYQFHSHPLKAFSGLLFFFLQMKHLSPHQGCVTFYDLCFNNYCLDINRKHENTKYGLQSQDNILLLFLYTVCSLNEILSCYGGELNNTIIWVKGKGSTPGGGICLRDSPLQTSSDHYFQGQSPTNKCSRASPLTVVCFESSAGLQELRKLYLSIYLSRERER